MMMAALAPELDATQEYLAKQQKTMCRSDYLNFSFFLSDISDSNSKITSARPCRKQFPSGLQIPKQSRIKIFDTGCTAGFALQISEISTDKAINLMMPTEEESHSKHNQVDIYPL